MFTNLCKSVNGPQTFEIDKIIGRSTKFVKSKAHSALNLDPTYYPSMMVILKQLSEGPVGAMFGFSGAEFGHMGAEFGYLRADIHYLGGI